MKKLVLIIVIITITFFGYKYFSNSTPTSNISDKDAELILFWGDGCPHCEVVKKYIKDNDIDSKIKIAYKEVYYNKTNQQQLQEIVKKCPEINSSEGVGVPLGFSNIDTKCLYGDKPIQDWLSSKIN